MNKAQKTFKGGYRFTHFKGTPGEMIKPLEAPGTITLPLRRGPEGSTEPSVKVGDEVRAGQVIGTGPVHSPVDGTVSAISKAPAVIIEKKPGYAFGKDDVIKLAGASADWRKLDAASIEGYIYNSGAACLDAAGIPTRHGSSTIGPEEVERLIVRIIGDELLPACDSVLLPDNGIESFLEGLRMLEKLFPQATITIAVSSNWSALFHRIEARLLPDDRITLLRVSDSYPQSFEQILVSTVTGDEFPYGFNAVNIGVVLLSVQTVLAVYDAVTSGTPVLSRIIALGGTGFKENPHLQVPLGTPWEAIIEKYRNTDRDYRFVKNSLLTGKTIEDPSLPVTIADTAVYGIPEARSTELLPFASPGFFKDSYSKTFPASVLPIQKKLDTNIHGEGRACLSCSFCADVCPVGILPNMLHRYVLRELIEESLVQFGIFKCIDCNLCTYVCPSKIPVARLISEGKQLLRKEGLGNEGEIKSKFSLKGI